LASWGSGPYLTPATAHAQTLAAIKYSKSMKGTIVRVCAWFTMIIFVLTFIAGIGLMFTENFNVPILVAPLVCLLMSATGWYARKFGLSGFKIHVFSKTIAGVSLILGIVSVTLFPILFANLFGFKDSWLAIRNMLILFLPVVISSIAILSSKSDHSTKRFGQPDSNDNSNTTD